MNKGTHALSLKEEGKTNQEIADELGMSAKSVRRLVSETRKRREYLADYVSPPARVLVDELRARGANLPPEWGQVKPYPFDLATLPPDWAPPGYVRKPRPFPQDDHATGIPYRKCGGECGETRYQSSLFVCDECVMRPPVSAEKYTTHLVIPDTQCRPDVPLEHLVWAGQYIKEIQPDVVVHLGDHWDFPSLSSYEKIGSKWFEGKRVLADIEAGNRGLELLEESMNGFQPKRKILLRGNHEDRLTRALNDQPRLEGLVGFDKFNDVALGWEVVPFLEVKPVDDIWYSHYFANPLTGKPYGGMPETMLKSIGHSFTMGHRQGRREASRYLADGSEQRALIVGSYYQHTEDYLGAQGNHHWRGLIVKREVRNGTYDMMEVSLRYLRARFGS